MSVQVSIELGLLPEKCTQLHILYLYIRYLLCRHVQCNFLYYKLVCWTSPNFDIKTHQLISLCFYFCICFWRGNEHRLITFRGSERILCAQTVNKEVEKDLSILYTTHLWSFRSLSFQKWFSNMFSLFSISISK